MNPELTKQSLLCGLFTSIGYASQSISLLTIPPSTVAFLGASTVIICPLLERLIDSKKITFETAPQTIISSLLCILGVAVLEGILTSGLGDFNSGDVFAILQAVGFGTSFFLTEKLMRSDPSQALSITSVQCGVCAFVCGIWCLLDSSLDLANTNIIELATNDSLKITAAAVVFTGAITTAGNRFVETTALGKMSSSEASVVLATEPIWAAGFGSWWVGETFGVEDWVGGGLIVIACLVNSLKPEQLSKFFSKSKSNE
ncbi:hypothetical protein TL16_g06197 [Triparma laevis f. inornata]|uniref:EamA domain-containing protein n=1 Tax=Triparma laevis f. inornata TaxID=1714386 RepID=A0A9W7AKN1_9STRA|nr:hypothetical protein TL16_g06197 [Triparma laevis f. inornata]